MLSHAPHRSASGEGAGRERRKSRIARAGTRGQRGCSRATRRRCRCRGGAAQEAAPFRGGAARPSRQLAPAGRDCGALAHAPHGRHAHGAARLQQGTAREVPRRSGARNVSLPIPAERRARRGAAAHAPQGSAWPAEPASCKGCVGVRLGKMRACVRTRQQLARRTHIFGGARLLRALSLDGAANQRAQRASHAIKHVPAALASAAGPQQLL